VVELDLSNSPFGGWDWALVLSQEINAYARAGTGGNNIIAKRPVESIDVEESLLSSNHNYVFEAGKVLSDFSTLIATEAAPDAHERGLSKIAKDHWHYWRFPQMAP
jgi:hypothetical protein